MTTVRAAGKKEKSSAERRFELIRLGYIAFGSGRAATHEGFRHDRQANEKQGRHDGKLRNPLRNRSTEPNRNRADEREDKKSRRRRACGPARAATGFPAHVILGVEYHR